VGYRPGLIGVKKIKSGQIKRYRYGLGKNKSTQSVSEFGMGIEGTKEIYFPRKKTNRWRKRFSLRTRLRSTDQRKEKESTDWRGRQAWEASQRRRGEFHPGGVNSWSRSGEKERKWINSQPQITMHLSLVIIQRYRKISGIGGKDRDEDLGSGETELTKNR